MTPPSSAEREKYTASVMAAIRCMAATSLPPPQQYDTRVMDHEYHFLSWKLQILIAVARFVNTYICSLPKLVPSKKSGGLFFSICRMHHGDELLVDALQKHHIEQVVFLGIGADCRSTRYATEFLAAGAKSFEVDLPGMQHVREQILSRHIFGDANRLGRPLLPSKAHIISVACNFEQDKIDDLLLSQTQFDVSKKSLVIWEGVAVYLTKKAMDTTMRSISALCAPGSLFTFDFMLESIVDGKHPDEEARAMVRRFAQNGEPLLWGLDPDKLEAFLGSYEFDVVDHGTPEKLQERYLMQSDGVTPFVPLNDYFHLVVAQKR